MIPKFSAKTTIAHSGATKMMKIVNVALTNAPKSAMMAPIGLREKRRVPVIN